MKQVKITIPSFAQIGNNAELSDYALALGAVGDGKQGKKGQKKQFGYILTRNVASFRAGITAYHNGQKCGIPVNASTAALMPCFQNPEAAGVGLAELNGQSVLTIDNKVVQYPQTLVHPFTAERLWDALMGTGKLREQEIGEYTTDLFPYYSKTNKCYHYQGKNYVHVLRARSYKAHINLFANDQACEDGEDYWFLCEPVRATRELDGSIRCQDLILPCRFENDKVAFQERNLADGQELNVDEFYVGKFMRECLFTDFVRSTHFDKQQTKMSTVKSQSVKNNLLNNIQEREIKR